MLRHGENVLVATPRQVDDHQMVARFFRREARGGGDRMGGLERRDDPLQPAAQLEGGERLLVGRRNIGRAAGLLQPGMLRSYAGIVEPGGNRMALVDLAVVVHQEIAAVAAQYARPPPRERAGVAVGNLAAVAGPLDAIHFNARIDEEGMEEADA